MTKWQASMKEFMANKNKAGLNIILDSITALFEENEKLKQQLKDYRKYANCKGNTEYILLGTGIGTATTLRCTKCGEKENITDYDGW